MYQAAAVAAPMVESIQWQSAVCPFMWIVLLA